MSAYIPLPGSKRSLLPNSRPAGPVDLAKLDDLTIRVRSNGRLDDLEKRVHEESRKPLAERQYLSRAELASTQGASAADLDAVEHFANQHNLAVAHRSSAERSVVLKGTVGDLLKAFPADISMYHHSRGTYRGRRGEIKIPQELDGIVTGVFGWDTRTRHRSLHTVKTGATGGPGGENGMSATVFAKHYNFPTLVEGTKLDGTGQTIAIIELGGGYRTSDLKVFFQKVGIPMPSISAVSVDHAGNNPSTFDSDDGEVMLDLEVAGAVAPKAKYVVYYAPNDGDQGFSDAISAAIHDAQRNPSVISISWGGPESISDLQGIHMFHDLFTQAAAAGITVCAATGDHGTADMDAQHWDGEIHVDHPAVDDMVLACGGTQINQDNQEEVAWNDGKPFDVNIQGGGGWAGGGGVSQVFQVPAYQTNASIPLSIATGKPGRGIPDIAMSATNYFTRVASMEGPSGGTSAVAPLMASLVVLLNQAKGKNVGFLNPFLYANVAKGVVHDVTSGSNSIHNTVEGYKAGPGWDACTGLGTPDGMAILNNL